MKPANMVLRRSIILRRSWPRSERSSDANRPSRCAFRKTGRWTHRDSSLRNRAAEARDRPPSGCVRSRLSRWPDFVCSRLTAWSSTTSRTSRDVLARHARSPSYPPSTPRFTHTTRLPSSRFRRSCTDAWARTRAKCSRAGSTRVRAAAGRRISVFVGAPRGRSQHPGLPLAEAYALARAAPNLVLGGIAIAERHVAKEDEHQRMLAKQDARLSLLHHAVGVRCRFHEIVAFRLRIVIAGVPAARPFPSCSRSRPVARCARSSS